MKTSIYYFTGTGNSLAVARDLAESLQESAEIIPIAKVSQDGLITINSNVVVIVYPTWFHGLPPIVEEFSKKIIMRDCYVMGICTYFINPYNTLFELDSVLKQNGGGLNAGVSIQMPGKHVLLKDLTASSEEQEIIYQ